MGSCCVVGNFDRHGEHLATSCDIFTAHHMVWYGSCYGSWCTDTVLVIAKLLCDSMVHDASGLPHNVGNICLVRVCVW